MNNVNLAALPADHYAAPAELHLMGERRDLAAEYLGVVCLPQQGYLEPSYVEPAHLTTATEPTAKEAVQLGAYIAEVGQRPITEVLKTANEVAGTPDIAVKVRPEHSHAAAVAGVAASRAARAAAHEAWLATQQQPAAVAQS